MSVTLNSTSGAVVYQPDMMQLANILASDQTVTSSTTLSTTAVLGDFTIPLGKSERVIVDYNLFFTCAAAGGIKYNVNVLDPTALAAGTLTQVAPQLIQGANTRVDGAANYSTTTPLSITTTNGADVSFTLTTNTSGYANTKLVLIGNATSNSVITLRFTQSASSATATVLKAGSWVEYRKF